MSNESKYNGKGGMSDSLTEYVRVKKNALKALYVEAHDAAIEADKRHVAFNELAANEHGNRTPAQQMFDPYSANPGQPARMNPREHMDELENDPYNAWRSLGFDSSPPQSLPHRIIDIFYQ